MYDLAEAMQYPVDNTGHRYDLRFLIPTLAFHLARCGFQLNPEARQIKPRRLPPGPSVAEDAIEWVPLDAAESIDDELAGKTIEDIPRMSRGARAEFIRRLGGDAGAVAPPEPDDLDSKTPWHVETHIHFDEGLTP